MVHIYMQQWPYSRYKVLGNLFALKCCWCVCELIYLAKNVDQFEC
jgi:hypothetical protein